LVDLKESLSLVIVESDSQAVTLGIKKCFKASELENTTHDRRSLGLGASEIHLTNLNSNGLIRVGMLWPINLLSSLRMFLV
jgi:hypothetical protein